MLRINQGNTSGNNQFKPASPNKGYKHISEVYKEGIDHIIGRRNGTIKSILTPWQEFNDAGIDGLEWNTITVIAGRPASGKTLVVNQLTREAFDLNPLDDFCVLDCQWEMLGRTMAIREFSSRLDKTIRELNSAG